MSSFKFAVAAALLAAGAAAQAVTINLATSYVGPNVYVATLNTAAGKDFTPNNGSDSIKAGPLQAVGVSDSFLAYGIEPIAPLTTSLTTYDSASYTAPLAVQQLYSGFYDRVVNRATGIAVGGDNIDEVAFQIALWELAVDDGSLSAGDLSFSGVTGAATLMFVARAQFFLSNLPATVTNHYAFSRYSAANTSGLNGALTGSQDLLRATAVAAVPELGTCALMVAGLAAVGIAGRRRQQA